MPRSRSMPDISSDVPGTAGRTWLRCRSELMAQTIPVPIRDQLRRRSISLASSNFASDSDYDHEYENRSQDSRVEKPRQ